MISRNVRTHSNTGLGAAPLAPRDEATMLICFSHLRWRFVWQRPQHLLTRMARKRPVYVVEEPVFHEGGQPASLLVAEDAGVTILTPTLPETPGMNDGFSEHTNPAIQLLLSTFFRTELSEPEAIVWYYTPMALGALPGHIVPTLVVFDAMDELSNFMGAPDDLKIRERRMLRDADLVFAGGPSLYERRKHQNPQTHCFPSGVDAAHFSQEVDVPPADVAALPGPIVGFYGVLDERVDFGLIDSIAQLRPEWTITLIGPVVKIDEAPLPRRDNIRYLGMRPYSDLPAYLAQFDAAILPFALNEATKFISPTKTLEYLAGGKPVVSTPIKDVVDLYGSVVEIASTPTSFVDAIEHLWSEPAERKLERDARIDAVLAEHDWESIARRMESLIESRMPVRAGQPVLMSTAGAWLDQRSHELSDLKREVGD